MKKNTAIFMDRDGTINEEVGYLSRLEQLKLYPGASKAIRMINEAGMKAVVVTNQSGVARGFFTEAFVDTVHRRINEMLRTDGAHIDGFYYCPHHPDGQEPYNKVCDCRKPATGLLVQASEELDINLTRSWIIGDTLKDIDAGKKAGVRGILVKTGYGQNIVVTDNPVHIAENILDAVQWIMREPTR